MKPSTEAPARVSSTELPDRMRVVLNDVQFKGKQYIITRQGEDVAKLVPCEGTAGRTTQHPPRDGTLVAQNRS